MADQYVPVRSYQRIFRPERRIYQIEGHRLPVPGGVPLRWLGYATVTLLGVLALSGQSLALSLALGLMAGAFGLRVGGHSAAMLAGSAVVFAGQAAGLVLARLDWPLRLVVVPALAATLLTQATPDGRPAHRYVLSRLGLWLSPPRRSSGRELAARGERHHRLVELWVAPDERASGLRRARVHGEAMAAFAEPMPVARCRLRRRRFRTVSWARREDGSAVGSFELSAGELLEVGR